MNLLRDSHILIWALNDDPRLPEKAREMILDPNNVVYYSAVSVWEISIKHANHPDNVEFTGRELSQFCQDAGFFLSKYGISMCLPWKRSREQQERLPITIPLIEC